ERSLEDSDENLRHLTAEAGHDLAAVEVVCFREPRHVGQRAVDAHAAPPRVHYPHGPCARREPVLHLLFNLLVAVARAEDFDRKVGRDLPEILRDARLWDSLAADEGYVGGAHGVRVSRQFKSRLGAESLAQVVCLYVLA